jgi:hypothetical protein
MSGRNCQSFTLLFNALQTWTTRLAGIAPDTVQDWTACGETPQRRASSDRLPSSAVIRASLKARTASRSWGFVIECDRDVLGVSDFVDI